MSTTTPSRADAAARATSEPASRTVPPAGPGKERRAPRSHAFNTMSTREKVVRYVLLVLVLVITVGPFLWQLSTSLKGLGEDIYTRTPSFLPQQPTLASYAEVARTIPVWRYAFNSVLVAVMVVGRQRHRRHPRGLRAGQAAVPGAPSRPRAAPGDAVLPGEVTIIAQYVTVRSMGLADSLVGVALPGAIGMLNVLLMRAAFQAIPDELETAARVDGANAWQRLRHIGLPSVRGMLSVICIFAFIGAWDDFLWPLIVLTDPENYT